MAIEFACPECNHPVTTADTQGGKQGRCPNCRIVFTIPESTATTDTQPAEKTIRFECQICQKKLKVPASRADKKITCPECGNIVTNDDIKSSGSLSGSMTTDGKIEFPCGECGHIVQTPLEQAGKKGRCPECEQIMQIPVPRGNPANLQTSSRFAGVPPPAREPDLVSELDIPQAETEIGPLDELDDWHGSSSTPTVSRLPGSDSQGGGRYRVHGPRKGLPWDHGSEDRSPFRNTVTSVLFSPLGAFSRMHCDGGTGRSLGFALGGQLAGAGIAVGYLLLFIAIALISGILYAPEEKPIDIVWTIVGGVIFSLAVILTYLVAIAINCLLQGFALSAFQHLGLAVLQGTYQTFEATCRVVNYVQGSLGPLMILTPVIGLPLQAIAMPIYVGIGCYAAHETSKLQAIVGTLIGCLLWYGMFFGTGWLAYWLVADYLTWSAIKEAMQPLIN